ncbi:autotransporter domain-containing protein [Azospira inquinata]|uniref:Autotransporter domain-containing protein n=1 Tax=Azospira inquinata TaxID=2785627 RepID=A0A975XV90_9RHOO|nr:autotransporter domain-containing protein [Azospira inquinata]QWT45106.1 autotransporter domain-containing protein [Azospira inquinata]QWT49560.1 autotransporter domain-containing protein [Azospira inquinata]
MTIDSQTRPLGTSLGRTYALSKKARFTLSVSADYTETRGDGYQEKRAGLANLKVQGHATEALVVGGKLHTS